jgi:hypothetical protein
MHHEIRPSQPILIEGRQFTPDDLVGTITLEDTELPDGRSLNVFDVLNFLQYRQFAPIDPNAATEAAEADTEPQRANWYEQADGDSSEEAQTDDEDTASEDDADPPNAQPDNAGQPIDLPKTVLEQLASKGIKTLEDASEFLLSEPTQSLGISTTAVKRLLSQLSVAGLPDGQSSTTSG